MEQFNCQMFLQFLDEVIESKEEQAQLQEFMGYCFLRDARFAKALILAGPVASGKTVVVDMIRHLVGLSNCISVPFDKKLQDNAYQLYGKAVNISEFDEKKYIFELTFKSIICNDTQLARRKYAREYISFIPDCKHILISNEPARTNGWRTLFINFRDKPYSEVDHTTFEDIIPEKHEIFRWAQAGLTRLIENNGFTTSIPEVGTL